MLTMLARSGCGFGRPVVALVAVAMLMAALPAPASGATEAYWRFENGQANQAATGIGTILDSSGNGLNSTPQNGPVYRTLVPDSLVPQTGAGNGLALEFNGTSQGLILSDTPGLALTHGLTLEAYICPHAIRSQIVVIRGDARSAIDPYYLAQEGTNLTFAITKAGDTQPTVRVMTPVPAVNTWMHVAGTLDDATGQMSIYIDGVLKSSTITTARPFGALQAGQYPGISIGTLSRNEQGWFDGMIDEVRISDVALTPEQFLNTPEPATVSLLALGGLAMLRRKAAKCNLGTPHQ